MTDAHTAPCTTVLPIEAAPTYALGISTGVPAVFVRFRRARSPRPRTRGRAARADQLRIETILQVHVLCFFTRVAELLPALG